jgi:fatty-acyl-CoA synthase
MAPRVFFVPAQWQLLCDDPSLASRDLSALKTVSWGAAPATTTLLRRMAELFPGAANVAVFGQTEMSPVTCALSGEDALRKIGSAVRPVSIVAARVVDDDMKDVPPGEVGEIVFRVMKTALREQCGRHRELAHPTPSPEGRAVAPGWAPLRSH